MRTNLSVLEVNIINIEIDKKINRWTAVIQNRKIKGLGLRESTQTPKLISSTSLQCDPSQCLCIYYCS